MIFKRPFLLMVGDDGAILIPPRGTPILASSHEGAESVPLLHALAEDPARPILLLADTLGQEVRQETLPPLPFWDRRKLLKRRLAQAFKPAQGGDEPLKGSLPLRGGNALLACLHTVGPVTLWQERLAALSNPLQGIALLPIESAPMLTRLHSETREGWGLLLTMERTGGFRQIVTFNGAPILTRLTAPLPVGASGNFAMGSIAVDLQATRDYLLRFGITPGTPLRLVALLPENLHEAILALSLESTEITVLTPHEAAKSLLLPVGPAPDDPASDLLHAAWLQSRFFPRLILMDPAKRAARLHETVRWAGLAAAGLLWCFLLGAMIISGSDLSGVWRRGDHLKTSIAALKNQIAEEQKNLAPLSEPLGQLRQAVAHQRVFESKDTAPFPDLAALQESLSQELFLTSLTWNPSSLEIALRLPPDQGMEAIEETLIEKLPDYDITRSPNRETGFLLARRIP